MWFLICLAFQVILNALSQYFRSIAYDLQRNVTLILNQHWFWTKPLVLQRFPPLRYTNRLCKLSWRTQLHSRSSGGCHADLENRGEGGEHWGHPIRPIPQEKFANTEILCRKIIEEIPILHLDPFIILLKVYLSQASMHQMALPTCNLFLLVVRKSARPKPLWTYFESIIPLSASKNAR